MLGLIDETVLASSSKYTYVIAAVALVGDAHEARRRLKALNAGRSRPFHWSQEGPHARRGMAAAMADLDVIGAVFTRRCARRGQEDARAVLLTASLQWLVEHNASRVLIEQRGVSADCRDQETVDTFVSRTGSRSGLPVEWAPKSEPLLWLADGLAGAARGRYTKTRYPEIDRAVESALDVEWYRLVKLTKPQLPP